MKKIFKAICEFFVDYKLHILASFFFFAIVLSFVWMIVYGLEKGKFWPSFLITLAIALVLYLYGLLMGLIEKIKNKNVSKK